MSLYLYTQNNSGGSFDFDEKLTQRVAIEADSEEEANEFAFSIGIYFNGCDKGIDCDCCGDRWYKPRELSFPSPYGRDCSFDNEVEYLQHLTDDFSWENPGARIFYANGKVVELTKQENQNRKKK